MYVLGIPCVVMSYMLPTRNQVNRQRTVRFNPRREGSNSHGCTRQLNCPHCYRQRLSDYGRLVRVPVSRPRPGPRRPPQVLPPSGRYRSIPVPIVRRTGPVYTHSLYNNRHGLELPGSSVVMNNRDDTCSICLCDYMKNAQCQKLPCDHIFHVTCFQKWFRRKTTCPLCRKSCLK